MAIIEGELWTSKTGNTADSLDYGVLWNTEFHDNRMDYILSATELTGIGLQAGDSISKVKIWVEQLPGRTMNNVRIAMKHTALATLSATWQAYSTFTELFNATSLAVSATGWYTFTFSSGFVWDGTSNIILHTSRDDSGWASGGATQSKNTGTNIANYYRDDSGATFPFETGTPTVTGWVPRTYIVANRNSKVLLTGKWNYSRRNPMYIAGKRFVRTFPAPLENMAAGQHFRLYPGEQTDITISLGSESAGLPFKWTVRSMNSSIALLTKKGMTNELGEIKFTLLAEETPTLSGVYYHEGEIRNPRGNISAVVAGTINI